jgi:hypothetical protein
MKTVNSAALFSVIFFMILFALIPVQISAQEEKTLHEVSIYGGGGLSFAVFPYSISKSSSFGFHGCGGIGFTAFFNPQWGFHTGLGFGMNHLKINVDEIKNLIHIGKNDLNTSELPGYEEGFDRELHTTLSGYHEIHKTMFLNIPVMLQFQTKQKQHLNWKKGQRSGFYAMAGLNFLLLLNNKYDVEVQNLNNLAYYPEIDNWAGSQQFMGLGTFPGNSKEGSFNVGVLAMFAFETGIKWRVGKKTYLYTGAYFDCGLHDPTKKYRHSPGDYTTPESIDDINLLAFSNRINHMAAGIKLRLAFALPKKREPCYR